MLKNAFGFIAWILIAVIGVWVAFGWQVAGGVALMAFAAGVADMAWDVLTGKTVSEWFYERAKSPAGPILFVCWLAVGLALHLLGI